MTKKVTQARKGLGTNSVSGLATELSLVSKLLLKGELLHHGRRSVIVAENNSVVKPKCQQHTSLNKMLSNFSKVLMAHISFTAVINNGGIGKGIGGIWKDTKKNYIYVL